MTYFPFVNISGAIAHTKFFYYSKRMVTINIPLAGTKLFKQEKSCEKDGNKLLSKTRYLAIEWFLKKGEKDNE